MSDISLKVTSDSSQARNDLDRLTKSVSNIDKVASNTSQNLGRLAATVTSAFAAFSAVRAINRASDSFTNLENRIALVVGRTSKLIKVQDDLYKVSIRTRSSLQGSVEVFNRFGLALEKAGTSTSDLLKVTESVQKAVALSGASAESANAAIVQLGQGLASGQLRGQELLSVLEQTPRVAKAIADNIGVGIGEIRKIAEEGGLTTQVVFDALINQSEKLNKEFQQLSPTFAQGLDRAGTAFNRLLAELAKSTGFTNLIGKGLSTLADRLDGFTTNVGPAFELFSTRLSLLKINISLISSAFSELFSSIYKQILLTLPLFRFFTTPFEVLARGPLFQAIRENFNSFFDSVFRVREQVRGLIELFGGFVIFGDTQLSRNIARIFNAKSVQEFTNEIRKLARGLDPTDILNNYSTFDVAIRDNIVRPFKIFQKDIKSVAASLGLIKNPLLEISFIRFDRFFGFVSSGLDTIALLFTSKITPAIITLSVSLKQFGLNTIAFLRSLFGIGTSFTDQLARALTSIDLLLFNEILGSLLGLTTPFGRLNTALKELSVSLIAVFGNLSKVGKLFIDIGLNSITKLFEKLNEFSTKLEKPLAKVREFAIKVKEYFFDIYDKVVGNSYWPDTVKGIIDWTDKLYSNVIPKIRKFGSEILTEFSKTFSKAKNIFANSLDIELKIKDINLDAIQSKLKQSADVLSAIGGFVVASIVTAFSDPELYKKINKFLIIGLRGTFAGVIISQINEAFNVNTLRSLGQSLGTLFGIYVSTLVSSIPSLLQGLVDFIDGFASNFLNQLGIVGQAISGFAKLFTFGEGGLLGYILLGSLPLLLSNIKIVQQTLSLFTNILPKTPNGLLGQALLGENFKFLLAGISVIFASLNENSNKFAAAFVAAPLLATAILGQDITGKIIRDSAIKLFGWLFAQTIILGQKLTKTRVFENIFGTTNAKSLTKGLDFIKTQILDTITSINDPSNRKKFLNNEIGINELFNIDQSKVNKVIESTFSNLSAKVKNVGSSIKSSALYSYIVGDSNKIAKGVNAGIVASTVAINKLETVVNSTTLGKEGLFGRLVLGKNFKFIAPLVISALLLVSTAARAATSSIESETTGMLSSFLSFVGEFGFIATLFPAVGLMYLTKYFSTVFSIVAGTLTKIFTLITVGSSTSAGALVSLSGLFRSLVSGIVLFGKGLLSVITLGFPLLLKTILLAMKGLYSAVLLTASAVNILFAALLRLLANPVVIAITLAVAAAGVLGTYFFGEGDNLSEKFDNLLFRLGQVFTLSTKLEKSTKAALAPKEIGGLTTKDFNKDLEQIDFKLLNDNLVIRKKLEAAIKSFSEVQQQASKEEEEFGNVTSQTISLLKEKEQAVQRALDTAKYDTSIKGVQTATKNLANTIDEQFLSRIPLIGGLFDSSLGELLARYTQFNDEFAKNNLKTFKEINTQIENISPLTSEEDLKNIKNAIVQYDITNSKITGLAALFSKFRGIDNDNLKESIRLQGILIQNLLAEAAARAKLKQDAKDLNNVYSEIKALGSEFGIEVDLSKLFTFNKTEADAFLSFYRENLKRLKKQVDESPTSEIKFEREIELQLFISRFKASIDNAGLKYSIQSSLDKTLENLGLSINLNSLISSEGFDTEKLSKVIGKEAQLLESFQNATERKARAPDVASFISATQDLVRIGEEQFNLLLNSINSQTGKLSVVLTSIGISAEKVILDSLDKTSLNLLEKLSTRAKQLDTLAKTGSLTTNQAREKINLRKDIEEILAFANKTSQEIFVEKAGAAGIQISIDDLFRLDQAEISRLIKQVESTYIKMRELRKLNLNSPVDVVKALNISEDIRKEREEVEETIKYLSSNLNSSLSNAFSKASTSLSPANLFEFMDLKDLQLVDNLNKSIENLELRISRIKGKKIYTLNDINTVKTLNIELEENRKKLERLIPDTLENRLNKLLSKIGINTGENFILGFNNNVSKGLNELSAEFSQLQDDLLKTLTVDKRTGQIVIIDQEEFNRITLRLRSIKKETELIVNETKTLGEAFSKINKAGFSLSNLDLLKVGIESTKTLLKFSEDRDNLEKDILDNLLKGNSLDNDKVKAYEKLLKLESRIKDIQETRKNINDSILSTTREQIANLLKGKGISWRAIADSLSNTFIDSFANKLNNFLFKNVAENIGNIFGFGLDNLFGSELGSSMTNAMWVQWVGQQTNDKNPAISALDKGWNWIKESFTSIFSSISTKFNDFSSSLSTIFSSDNSFIKSLSEVFSTSVNSLTSILSSIGPSLTNILPGISSGFSSAGSWVSSLFSFASGGQVSGPGSGTSDSILARVSNGEYIVNAAATARNRTLLEAINSGKMPRFADGGIVGSPGLSSGNNTESGDSNTALLYGINSSINVLAGNVGNLTTEIIGMKSGIATGFSTVTNTIIGSVIPLSIGMALLPLTISSIVATVPNIPTLGYIGGWGSAIISAILATSFSPFASGGYVSGPGTGTSDSILARLSNGEYVINAAATSKYKPLLEMINSGNMPKFADGGLVGSVPSTIPSIPASTSSSLSSSNQVINITITGDISRQTKSEIYRMLPEIATGVNRVNKENNFKYNK